MVLALILNKVGSARMAWNWPKVSSSPHPGVAASRHPPRSRDNQLAMAKPRLLLALFAVLAVSAPAAAQEKTIEFVCLALSGHTCQFSVRTAKGPVGRTRCGSCGPVTS